MDRKVLDVITADVLGRLELVLTTLEKFLLQRTSDLNVDGLSVAQALIVVRLVRSGRAMSRTELHHSTYCGANLNHNVSKLQQRGYLASEKNETGRRTSLTPTAKAKEFAEAIEPVLRYFEEHLGHLFTLPDAKEALRWVEGYSHDIALSPKPSRKPQIAAAPQ